VEIPGYRIVRLIAKGGMAAVFLAIQESLERPIALKLMNPAHIETPELAGRFIDEARIVAALNHTHIITIYDVGLADKWLYISMELAEGGDLSRRIAEGLTPQTALELLETLARALGFAHERGVVHRDVKPANILFRLDGAAVLTDFGIAKELRQGADRTLAGSLLGSPFYLSPEQARGGAVGPQTDLYSLGALFYEMLTGQLPFWGDSPVAIVMKHIKEPVPQLPYSLTQFQSLVDHTMAKSIDDRFQTAAELLAAIAQLKGESVAVAPLLPQTVSSGGA
jgi:serine/threonine-protein kinase PpkA